MIYGLDLFSGIGGLALGLNEWVKPIAYCENDRYAQAVLLSRMQSGELCRAPIWDDVRTLSKRVLGESIPIDIIYGGFPCQDISGARTGAGLGGQRSGLFQHIARLVQETNPRFIFLENVPAIRTRGLNHVAQTFTELGYDTRWTIVSAAEVGAPHLRKRWFLLAHANGAKLWKQSRRKFGQNWKSTDLARHDGSEKFVANSMRKGLEGFAGDKIQGAGQNEVINDGLFSRQRWAFEPNVGRVANGVQSRVDRLRCLGNAVVPIQAKTAFERLMGIKP